MTKKGQITIFIILAIVILISGSLFFYFRSGSTNKEVQIEKLIKNSVNSLPIKIFTESCLKEILDNGINLVSKQGGYYNTPPLSTNYLENRVAYFYYLEQNFVPPIDKIGAEISKYVTDNLNHCLNDFNTFKEQGIKVEWKIKNISVKITDENVILSADLPIKIVDNGAENTISDFLVTINKKLKVFYDVSNEL